MDDLALALPGLLACARLPNVELHFFGSHPRYAEGTAYWRPGQYAWQGIEYFYHPKMDYASYRSAIGILDVAVAPQADTPFNKARSAAKWLEHSMHRTAMVLSDAPAYAPVTHGVTGFKALTPSEFATHLLRLVADAELRARIGAAAHAEVLRAHSVAARLSAWRDFLANIVRSDVTTGHRRDDPCPIALYHWQESFPPPCANSAESDGDSYTFAGHMVRLRVVGRALESMFIRRLRIWRCPLLRMERRCCVSICGMKPAAGVPCPSPPGAGGLDAVRVPLGGTVSHLLDGQIVYYAREASVLWLERPTQHIFGWYADGRALPTFERLRPLPLILAEWYRDRGLSLIHAGLVARDNCACCWPGGLAPVSPAQRSPVCWGASNS